MTSKAFIDTNVFVYSVDTAEPDKQRQAQAILADWPHATVSTQVLNEFFVTATRKLAKALSVDTATAIVNEMAQLNCVSVDASLVQAAITEGQRWQLSHWDALMLAAARRSGCDVVLTEDLSDGASYDGLRIENPFRLS
jgi:predicted nucleic acid-binding protein